jgi:hypothetical protein
MLRPVHYAVNILFEIAVADLPWSAAPTALGPTQHFDFPD